MNLPEIPKSLEKKSDGLYFDPESKSPLEFLKELEECVDHNGEDIRKLNLLSFVDDENEEEFNGMLSTCSYDQMKDAFIEKYCMRYTIHMHRCLKRRPDEFDTLCDYFKDQYYEYRRFTSKSDPEILDCILIELDPKIHSQFIIHNKLNASEQEAIAFCKEMNFQKPDQIIHNKSMNKSIDKSIDWF